MNVNTQNRHGSSSSSSISTPSNDSVSETSATCEDLVQSVEEWLNTDTGDHTKIKICITCKKESCDKHYEKKRAKISPKKRYVHLKGVRTYKEATLPNIKPDAKVKTSKRLNESLMKLANEMKQRIFSFGMNVAFVCKMGLKYWNMFGT